MCVVVVWFSLSLGHDGKGTWLPSTVALACRTLPVAPHGSVRHSATIYGVHGNTHRTAYSCVGGDLVGEAVKLVGEEKRNNLFCGSHKFNTKKMVPKAWIR